MQEEKKKQIVLRLRFNRFPDMRGAYWIKEGVSAAVHVNFEKGYRHWELLMFKGLILNFDSEGLSKMQVIDDWEVIGAMFDASLIEKDGKLYVRRINCYERVKIIQKPKDN